jgi:hypothetical protein
MMMMLFALMSLALSSSVSLIVAQDGGMFNEYEQRNLKSTLENILGKLISLEKSQDEIKSSQENMKKSIEISQEEIKGVKEILGALRDQNEKIVKGFSTLHNFGSDRVTTLEKISAPIVANCPVSKDQKVLDISRITNVNVGDEVVAYGFGHLAKAWKGIVCDKQVQNTVTLQWSGEQWSGGSGVRPGDFIVQGNQHVGMSGGPVSNGCGYVGMATIRLQDGFNSYAIVSPVSTIHECLRFHKEKLPTFCINEIEEIPKHPFACETEGEREENP